MHLQQVSVIIDSKASRNTQQLTNHTVHYFETFITGYYVIPNAEVPLDYYKHLVCYLNWCDENSTSFENRFGIPTCRAVECRFRGCLLCYCVLKT